MNENTGKLILRVALGVMILFHGIAKLKGGTAHIADLLEAARLPVFIQYGVYVGEVLAPLLLIGGYYARIGAWLIAVNMLFAIGLQHWEQLAMINEQSGGIALETQYIYMFTAIALALIGPGRWAINQK